MQFLKIYAISCNLCDKFEVLTNGSNMNQSRGDDGPNYNCKVHGLSPPSLGAPKVSNPQIQKTVLFWWLLASSPQHM